MRTVWVEGTVNRTVSVPAAGTRDIIKLRTRQWEDYRGGHTGSLEEGSRKDRVREEMWQRTQEGSQRLEGTKLLALKMEEAPRAKGMWAAGGTQPSPEPPADIDFSPRRPVSHSDP